MKSAGRARCSSTDRSSTRACSTMSSPSERRSSRSRDCPPPTAIPSKGVDPVSRSRNVATASPNDHGPQWRAPGATTMGMKSRPELEERVVGTTGWIRRAVKPCNPPPPTPGIPCPVPRLPAPAGHRIPPAPVHDGIPRPRGGVDFPSDSSFRMEAGSSRPRRPCRKNRSPTQRLGAHRHRRKNHAPCSAAAKWVRDRCPTVPDPRRGTHGGLETSLPFVPRMPTQNFHTTGSSAVSRRYLPAARQPPPPANCSSRPRCQYTGHS